MAGIARVPASGRISAPFPFPSLGLTLWLRPDRLVQANGSVDGWLDASGKGNDVAQSSSGNMPVLSPTGGPTGQPVVLFASASSQSLFRVATPVVLASPWTIFSVQKNLSPASTGYSIYVGNANTPNGLGLGQISSKRDIFYSGAAHLQGGTTTTSWEKWSVRNDGTTTTLRVNGVNDPLTNSSVQPVLPVTSTVIGNDLAGGQFWNGPIGEILCFNLALSAASVTAIEAYLFSRWGI